MELRLLSRQHCFAGYSLGVGNYNNAPSSPVFTRHHVIDWNYNPFNPRNRPNKWWVELQANRCSYSYHNGRGNNSHNSNNSQNSNSNSNSNINSNSSSNSNSNKLIVQSFKEFSIARDKYFNPVYFERWQRSPNDSNSKKYLALRKVVECPIALAKKLRKTVNSGDIQHHVISPVQRDGVFVIVGNHFLYSVDRDYTSLQDFVNSSKVDRELTSSAGGGSMVDALLGNNGNATSTTQRLLAEEYLDLEGSYGCIYNADPQRCRALSGDENFYEAMSYASHDLQPTWQILHSTHPWREGSPLLEAGQSMIEWGSALERNAQLWGDIATPEPHKYPKFINFCGSRWEVLECSLTPAELTHIFMIPTSDVAKSSNVFQYLLGRSKL